MNKSNPLLFLGIFFFSLTLGILIGVSSSPIAGVSITGVLAIAAAGIGYMFNTKQQKTAGTPMRINFSIVGIVLIVFSLSLLAGTYLGSRYRINSLKGPSTFVWNEDDKPISVDEALDWIVVSDNLYKQGYSLRQIQEIYAMRNMKAHRDTLAAEDRYNDEQPFYKMLLNTPEQKVPPVMNMP